MTKYSKPYRFMSKSERVRRHASYERKTGGHAYFSDPDLYRASATLTLRLGDLMRIRRALKSSRTSSMGWQAANSTYDLLKDIQSVITTLQKRKR